MKLTDYIRGERKGKEARRIELEAMGDPFMDEALEGYDSVEGDHAGALDRLSERLSHRIAQDISSGAGEDVRMPARREGFARRRAVWLSAAAVLVCGVLGGSLYRYYSITQGETRRQLAITEASERPGLEKEGIAPPARAEVGGIAADSREASESYGLEVPVKGREPIAVVSDVVKVEKTPEIEWSVDFSDFSEPLELVRRRDDESDKSEAAYSPITQDQRLVKGRVTDSRGEPLPGTVIYTDKGKNYITDMDGSFAIEREDIESTLQATFIGFEETSVDIDDPDSPLTIAMRERTDELGDVVVTGAFSKRKKSFTGAAKVITPEDLEKVRGRNIVQSLSEVTPQALVGSPKEPYFRFTGAQGFVAVSDAPFTAFPLYVRDALYGKVKTALGSSRLPDKKDVNTEEMINHFRYGYPGPKGRDAVVINFETGSCPWNRGNMLVLVNIRTKGSPSEKDILRIALRDAALSVEFDPAEVSSYRIVGYENGQATPHGSVTAGTAASEVGEGHTVTAIYEIVPTRAEIASGQAGKGALMTVKLSYKEPEGRREKKVEAVVRSSGGYPSGDFHFASAVAMFGQLLSGSSYIGGADFGLVISTARIGVGDDPDRKEFISLVEAAERAAQ